MLKQEARKIAENNILNKDIPDGELVVCMAIGRNSSGMHVGIQQGPSVRGLKSLYSPSNRYWIQNPTEEELQYKQKILDEIQKEQVAAEAKKQHRRSLKAIPYKELQIGHLYKDDHGDTYLFLGMCETTIKESRYKSDYNKDVQTITGYVCLSPWTYKALFESKPGDIPYGYRGDNDRERNFGRKTRKKLVEDLGAYLAAILPARLEFERDLRDRWSSDKWMLIEIKNLDKLGDAVE